MKINSGNSTKSKKPRFWQPPPQQRKIDEAEQELWTLTAEAQPDINKIEAKANEIAKLQADNRIAFIRSVGKAAEVLTEEQRQMLVGMAGGSDAMSDQ